MGMRATIEFIGMLIFITIVMSDHIIMPAAIATSMHGSCWHPLRPSGDHTSSIYVMVSRDSGEQMLQNLPDALNSNETRSVHGAEVVQGVHGRLFLGVQLLRLT